jgi:hypothetical protein
MLLKREHHDKIVELYITSVSHLVNFGESALSQQHEQQVPFVQHGVVVVSGTFWREKRDYPISSLFEFAVSSNS